mmetsp:Transcript_45861/g.98950  ORF Transcript_45861/g.98950 Transcript_45861/m.98950 type:complete len:94 (+) Transcript_45861:353-634(+)
MARRKNRKNWTRSQEMRNIQTRFVLPAATERHSSNAERERLIVTWNSSSASLCLAGILEVGALSSDCSGCGDDGEWVKKHGDRGREANYHNDR